MDLLTNVSCVLIPLAIISAVISIIVWFWLRRNSDVRTWRDAVARLTGVSTRPSDAVLQGQIARSDAIGLDAPMGDRLQATEADQAITIDGAEQTVLASVTWAEYWQRTEGEGDFVPMPKGLSFKMLVLGKTVILKMRSREGGTPIWLKTQRVVDMKLMTFFVGQKNGPPGPARRFRMGGQETPEPFQFPGALHCPSGTWSIVDIGRLKAEAVTGRTDYVEKDDFFPFVLAREGTPEDGFGGGWCVYLDPRPALSAGVGGLFQCVEFVPDQEVEALL